MSKSNLKFGLLSVGIALAALLLAAETEASPVYPLSDRWTTDANADEIGDKVKAEATQNSTWATSLQTRRPVGCTYSTLPVRMPPLPARSR